MRWALVIALLLSAGVASDAFACSCAARDPRTALAESRTAFTGVVESRREEHPNPGRQSTADPAYYVVRIERELKGDLPERVELETASGGATCGLEEKVGDRLGLALSDEPAPRMRAGLCQTVDPDKLIEAAGPFPQPRDGTGVRYLVPMALGDAGLAAYDAAGRLRAYGFGVEGSALAACPGGATALAAGDSMQVIRLRDLRVVSELPLPGDATEAVRCLSADGAAVAAMTFDFGRTSAARRLVRIEGGRVRTLRRAPSDAVALTDRVAVSVDERRGRWTAVAVDLASGAVHGLARGAGFPYAITARADGARVAIVHGLDEHSTGTRLGVVVLNPGRPGKLAAARLGVGAEDARPAYLGDRLAVLSHRRGVVLDRLLRRVGTLPAFSGGHATAAGAKLVVASERLGLRLAAPGAKRTQRLAMLPVPPRGAPLALAAPLTLEGHRTDAARPDAQAAARGSSPCGSKRAGTSQTSGRWPSKRGGGWTEVPVLWSVGVTPPTVAMSAW